MEMDQERVNTKKGMDAIKMAFEMTVKDIESTLSDQYGNTLQLLADNKEQITRGLAAKIEQLDEKMRTEPKSD